MIIIYYQYYIVNYHNSFFLNNWCLLKMYIKKDKVKCAYKLYVYLSFAAMRTLNERMHHIRCVQKEDKKDREVRGGVVSSTKRTSTEPASHAGKVVFFSKKQNVCI